MNMPMQYIQEKLKSARTAVKLTQLAVARAVGISAAQVSKLETGRAKATPELRIKLESVLHCGSLNSTNAGNL